jgi:hypothetical protein
MSTESNKTIPFEYTSYVQDLEKMNQLEHKHPVNQWCLERQIGDHHYDTAKKMFEYCSGPYVTWVSSHYNYRQNVITSHYIHRNKDGIFEYPIRYSKIDTRYEYDTEV